MKKKKQAFLTDWAILDYLDSQLVYFTKEGFPENAFSDLSDLKPVVLSGRAVNDPRSDPATGRFTDGHRLVTSLICEFKDGFAITENTMYILGEINENYKIWCETNNIDWQNYANLNFKISPKQFDKELPVGAVMFCEITGYIEKVKDLPDMKFQIGDKVSFIDNVNDKKYVGVIEIRDFGGSFGNDFHTYDIMVDDFEVDGEKTQILFKHIKEEDITRL